MLNYPKLSQQKIIALAKNWRIKSDPFWWFLYIRLAFPKVTTLTSKTTNNNYKNPQSSKANLSQSKVELTYSIYVLYPSFFEINSIILAIDILCSEVCNGGHRRRNSKADTAPAGWNKSPHLHLPRSSELPRYSKCLRQRKSWAQRTFFSRREKIAQNFRFRPLWTQLGKCLERIRFVSV